jgi:hypothetical protein
VGGGSVKVVDVAPLAVMSLPPLLPLDATRPLAVVVSVSWVTRQGQSLPHPAEVMLHLAAVASKMVLGDVRRIESLSESLRLHLRKLRPMANTARELSSAPEGSRESRQIEQSEVSSGLVMECCA